MADFNIGDVVMLKSGGPRMTVENAGNNANTGQPFVSCTWFNMTSKGSEKVTKSFTPEALVHEED